MEDQDPFDDDEEDDFFEPPPPPPPAPSRRSQPLEDYDDERIVSDATEAFGVASFAKLERSIRMGHSGETLEDVVKNLLRPMLRSWLDDNLPGMVERMVEDEIRNMASGAKRRWDDDDLLIFNGEGRAFPPPVSSIFPDRHSALSGFPAGDRSVPPVVSRSLTIRRFDEERSHARIPFPHDDPCPQHGRRPGPLARHRDDGR